MGKREKITSAVDWVDLKKEALYLRDKNLLSLIHGADFVDAIYHLWLHKRPSQKQKRMLNAVLVSFCGGWNITVPTIMAARLAATTKAPIAQCLAAGFCAGGPAHTSAIHEIMVIYLSKDLDEIDDYVRERLRNGEKVPGFGHPILKKDPRPPVLRKLCDRFGVSGEYVAKFDRIQEILNHEKGIHANIDGINGAILLDLGFKDASFGPAFFLMSRSLSMTAHVLEEYKNRPFKALDMVHPGFKKMAYQYAGALDDDAF